MVEINTTTTRPLPRWHIDGTLGSAESPYSLQFETRRWAQLTLSPVNEPSRILPMSDPGLDEVQIWEQFAAGTPAVTAQSVLPTIALLDAARESARTGKTIDLANTPFPPAGIHAGRNGPIGISTRIDGNSLSNPL